MCKIAHSQKLVAYVTEEDLDLAYRNEAALTVSLMGLLAEESLPNGSESLGGRRVRRN